jgi:hypothetical protein
VQHEREPLGGIERLEHDEQGKTDGVGAQVRPVGLDAVRQIVALVHRSHPLVVVRHRSDEPNAPT